MDSLPRAPRRRGFTLIELAVTLALLSTLAALGLPTLSRLGDGAKLRGFSSELLSHLYVARAEAIKRNARVALCKSADGASCTDTGGWEQGWIVFHDGNNDGVRQADETLVQAMAALPPGWRVAPNLNVARYISFHPNGGTRLVSGGFQAGTLTLCRVSPEPGPARLVVLNANGRPRVQATTIDRCL
jgi:type IV fimbrial biogenesis protein FimT